jgi:uncharacterized membrane protein YedE/YeeE
MLGPLLGLLLIVGGFSFWIWMIVDCATNESSAGNNKLVWIIIIVFTHIIGAFIYYCVRYRARQFAEWQRKSVP